MHQTKWSWPIMSFIQHTRQQLSLTDNHLKTQTGDSRQTQSIEMSSNFHEELIISCRILLYIFCVYNSTNLTHL